MSKPFAVVASMRDRLSLAGEPEVLSRLLASQSPTAILPGDWAADVQGGGRFLLELKPVPGYTSAVVKGDRERSREARRDAVRDLVTARVGTMVRCHPYGAVKLLRVNQKSATVQTASGFRDRVDLTWVDVSEPAA